MAKIYQIDKCKFMTLDHNPVVNQKVCILSWEGCVLRNR